LDAAPIHLALPAVDNLLATPAGVVCSSGAELISLRREGEAGLAVGARRKPPAAVTCLAGDGGGRVGDGLAGSGVLVQGGRHDGRMIETVGGRKLNCPTAALFLDPDRLLVANGSAALPAAEWKRDLMSWGASGSVWRIDLSGAKPEATPLA